MRDIKFRAWRTGKKMIYRELCDRNWYTEDNKQICGAVPEDKHWFEIMQYTGLTDKNGVEIYEGDILANHEQLMGVRDDHKRRVIFKDGQFLLDGSHHTLAWDIRYLDCEVIGNIYENPELLGGK